jgi:hypothetical protein
MIDSFCFFLDAGDTLCCVVVNNSSHDAASYLE